MKEEPMAMRDYDRDGNRGTNGIYGRDQQWQGQDDWSLGDFNRGERNEWSTRPRYGYGESDRGRGFSGQSYGQSDYGQGNYGRGNYGQGYGQSRYGRDDYGMYGRGGGSGRGWDRDRNEPGMWDRFKGEMREGWDRMRGDEGDEHMYRGRDRNEGLWDETKREMREGWEKVKETFRGRGPKGYMRSDDRIREDVCDRLAWHSQIDASNLEVMVKDGDVELSGTVDDRRQRRLAEDVVEDIMGVKDVTNRIKVSRQSSVGTTSTTGQVNPANQHARPIAR